MPPNIPKKRWVIQPTISSDDAHRLAVYHPVLQQILSNRGHTTMDTARNYLDARLPEGTEAYRMLGIAQAVERIRWAINHREKIAVYGDYDVDGVTATALLSQVLSSLEADVIPYIPNRFDEGYGLNVDAISNLKEQAISLIITVDCGIRSPEEADHARSLGIDMIISDHHQPAGSLPEAVAIINPKQPLDEYPQKELAGVGLAYKLAAALTGDESDAFGNPIYNPYLDLVALGTVADLAPLTGENRYLVRSGIEYLRRPLRQGVMALIGVSGLQPGKIRASHIGFVLGPRLNAAGRMESAQAALDLLTTSNVQKAAMLAQKLEIQNRERQKETQEIQQRAEQMVLEHDPDALIFFAADPGFNPGVVGLAASRLSDLYYRPAIVAHQGESFTRGSCRSIPEFHITNALDECADLLHHHGGHAAAAGFTVANNNLPQLITRLHEITDRELADLDLRPTLHADLEISLSDLKPELLKYLELLQPTGFGNRQAYFVSRSLKPMGVRVIGRDKAHLKFSVTDGWITFDAIAFQQGYWQAEMPARVDVFYTFELNEYNGRSSLQLNVRDLKPSGVPD
ncbi:MAG: single-stranded-DNA-specific exonuclease RecJ [Anaerolineales bacterium]